MQWTRVPEGKERKHVTKAVSEKITAGNFPEMIKNTKHSFNKSSETQAR